MFKKTSFLIIILGLIILGCATIFTQNSYAVTASEWKPGNIIDDALFMDEKSMSVSQIQAFLNSKVGTGNNGIPGQCDTNGIRTSELGGGIDYNGDGRVTRAEYGQTFGNPAPFTCLKDFYEVPKTVPGPGIPANNYGGKAIPAGAKSAAQLIWDAAQKYDISPKVLLIKLGTESAGPLTSDDWPFLRQYTYAMGAHCPDSGPGGSANCDTNYSGFSMQISEAAKMLRGYLNNMMESWWPYKKPYQVNSIYWNIVESGCGASYVFIENKATAALYTYTPYRPNQAALDYMYGSVPEGVPGYECAAYGNRNFWRAYNDWFGSTQFPQPIGASLYYQQSSKKIYLVNGSVRYYVPSWDMMINYGLNYYPVQTVSDSVIQNLTDGGRLTNLIYDDNGVYLVNNRYRHPISSNMCTRWGFDCMDHAKVKRLGNTFQTQYLQLGGVVTRMIKRSGVTYKISNGQKQPIANLKTLVDLGLSNTPVISATVINSRQPLGSLLMTTPGVVQFSPDPHIYYFNGANYFIVGDMETYDDWGLQKSTYLIVPVSSYNQTPPTATFLNSWAISNNQKYIVDQGRKLLVTSTIADIWPDSQYSAPPLALFNSLPSETMSQLISARPYVYLLDAGKKHYVHTMDEYLTLIVQYGKVTSIRLNKVSAVPQGNDALANGSLIIVQDGSGRIYVVNNDKLTYIPSPSVFNAYGYNWGAVREYSTAIMDDYAKDGKTLYNGVASDGTHYIVSGSTLYQLSSSLAQEFGAIDAKFTPISKQSVKRDASILSRFLLNSDDGRVYYATGGSLHYVSSYESFIQYGGGYTPRVSVNTQTIESFSEGQSL